MKAKLDAYCARFEVLTAEAVRFQLLWHIMPWELVEFFTYHNFRFYLPTWWRNG
jgi:hypothetical protein